MNHPPFSFPEILDRLGEPLKMLFCRYRISEDDAERILAEACQSLLYKKSLWANAERALLLSVIDRCRKLASGEDLEDPSQ